MEIVLTLHRVPERFLRPHWRGQPAPVLEWIVAYDAHCTLDSDQADRLSDNAQLLGYDVSTQFRLVDLANTSRKINTKNNHAIIKTLAIAEMREGLLHLPILVLVRQPRIENWS